MGHALSSLAECLGDFGTRYDRVSAMRRVEAPRERRRVPPPPLVPDKHAVYDLVDDEEDACPTCLELYTPDNPRIVADCGHSFHLQCIVAWETRSGSRYCPICAKVMTYREADAVKPV